MLSNKLKADVRKLWDAFWSGGIANPLTAIEQITYLIFLKRWEDLRERRETKTILDEEPYRWSYIRQLPNEECLKHLRTTVFEELRNIGGDAGTRMQGAELVISSPNLLRRAIDIIDNLFVPSRNQDTFGDIYEMLLQEIATAGKNGQFRTPRHIVNLMCDLVDPRYGERICDPACGSAGFLINAYQHILKRNTSRDNLEFESNGTALKLVGDKLLDPKAHESLQEGHYFYGYDFDRTMVRLGWMNMILHGIQEPEIHYANTLGSDFNNSLTSATFQPFDIVLANPPFTGNIEEYDIGPSLVGEPRTNKTELLFVELILQLLVEGGRAAVILPEGVLFGSTGAHKELRRKLITTTEIKAIVSLPGGVFQPYTGVKTSILVFKKGGETDSIWFYELANDGYTLDAKRTERSEQNDIWDLTTKYYLRYQDELDKPACINEQHETTWQSLKELDAEQRSLSYLLPLFVEDRLNDSSGNSIFPPQNSNMSEWHATFEEAHQEIVTYIHDQLEDTRTQARIRALKRLRRKSKGDRVEAALDEARKYLDQTVRSIPNLIERAGKEVLESNGLTGYGLYLLRQAIEKGMVNSNSFKENVMLQINETIQNSLEDMETQPNNDDDKSNGIDTEQIKDLVAPFAGWDGNVLWKYGRLRLLTPQVREQINELESSRFGITRFAEVPKDWEASVADTAESGHNFSAGRYKPFTLTTETYDPPAEIIRDLQELEGQIQEGLTKLLDMVEGRE